MGPGDILCRVLAQKRKEVLRRHWPRESEALQRIATKIAQYSGMRHCFDAFCNDLDSERFSDLND